MEFLRAIWVSCSGLIYTFMKILPAELRQEIYLHLQVFFWGGFILFCGRLSCRYYVFPRVPTVVKSVQHTHVLTSFKHRDSRRGRMKYTAQGYMLPLTWTTVPSFQSNEIDKRCGCKVPGLFYPSAIKKI